MLLLAGLQCFGPGHDICHPVLPKWQSHKARLSLPDLLTRLRTEIIETSVRDPVYAEMAKNLALSAKA
jgi:hypothetical protein